MTRKIYAFCNIAEAHDPTAIGNHLIVAIDDTGKGVGSWVSSNHSFGAYDVQRAINVDYEFEFEWVEGPDKHPVVSKILEGINDEQ